MISPIDSSSCYSMTSVISDGKTAQTYLKTRMMQIKLDSFKAVPSVNKACPAGCATGVASIASSEGSSSEAAFVDLVVTMKNMDNSEMCLITATVVGDEKSCGAPLAIVRSHTNSSVVVRVQDTAKVSASRSGSFLLNLLINCEEKFSNA